jgi:hypothetical protein
VATSNSSFVKRDDPQVCLLFLLPCDDYAESAVEERDAAPAAEIGSEPSLEEWLVERAAVPEPAEDGTCSDPCVENCKPCATSYFGTQDEDKAWVLQELIDEWLRSCRD